MFKKLYNNSKISFEIKPFTPLLIQSGKPGLDPTIPDMRFVRTKSIYGEVVYIPGSSLKGIIRSYSEKLLRTMGIEICNITTKSCDKYYNDYRKVYKKYIENKDEGAKKLPLPALSVVASFIQEQNKESIPEKLPYKGHCYSCRTFGSTSLTSRLRVTDSYPWNWRDDNEENREKTIERVMASSMVRTGTSINREKGTTERGALFDFEVITQGNFFGEITICNFQLWQLALLFQTLQDINEGYQQIGYAKSRGLGRVKLDISAIEIESYGPLAEYDEDKIAGIGEIEKERETYDLIKDDFIDCPEGASEKRNFAKHTGLYESKEINLFLNEVLKSNNWKNLLKRSKK